MSEFTGEHAEQIPVTLVYDNEDGDPIRYEVTMAYGNVGQLIMVMDTLDGEERPAKVGVLFEGDEGEEALEDRRQEVLKELEDMQHRIQGL